MGYWERKQEMSAKAIAHTGELLQKLHELEVKYDYIVIVLPHSIEIEHYLGA